MKKLILIITMFFLMLVSEACGQAYEAMRGTSVDTFSIGNKYWFELFRDKDSSWVKVRMSINGKDSILVFTDTTKVKKLIGIESKIREDADGNLLAHILLKANVTSVDSVKNRLSSAESAILLKAGRDELENAKDSLWAEIDLLAAIMESDTTSIEYALSQIELKANKTYVDSTKNNLQSSIDLLTAAVEEDSASIDYAMAQIGLKSNKTYVDSTKANLEAQISLSATIGSVDTLNNRLEYAVGQLSAKANTTKLDSVRNQIMAEVYLRARASYVDTIKVIQDTIRYEQDELIERVSIAEAGITANANQIVDAQGDIIDIQASLLLYAQKNNIISYINISPEEITISSDKITFDGDVIATALTSKTITGVTIQTAPSGARVVVNGASNRIEFWDASGVVQSYIDSDGGTMKFTGTVDGGGSVDLTNIDDIHSSNISAENEIFVAHGSAKLSLTATEIGYYGNYGSGWVKSATGATQEWVQSQNYLSTIPSEYVDNSELSTALLNYVTNTSLSTTLSNYVIAENFGALNTRVYALESYPFSSYLTAETDPTVYSWAKTSTKPSYAYSEITGTPTLFSGSYTDLTNKPTLFSGSYTDLTNKPTLLTKIDFSATEPLVYNNTTGNFNLNFNTPLINLNGSLAMRQAGTTYDGYLSSTDWVLFNGKASITQVEDWFYNSIDGATKDWVNAQGFLTLSQVQALIADAIDAHEVLYH